LTDVFVGYVHTVLQWIQQCSSYQVERLQKAVAVVRVLKVIEEEGLEKREWY